MESRKRSNDESNTICKIKGCPHRISQTTYNHQTFRDTLFRDDFQPPLARANLIRHDREIGVNTIHTVKSCLSLIENKRFWLSRYESLAYGHPDIPKNIHSCTDIVADRGAIIKNSIPTHEKLFGNNVADNSATNSNNHINHPYNEIVDQNMDDYDNYPDFFDGEIPSQNTDDYNDHPDFFDNNIYRDSSDGCNNHDVGSIHDIYSDSSYHDYSLINDITNHTIKTSHNSVNIHINTDEIICYNKCK